MTRVIDNPDWIDWWPRDILADEANGETINDAVYARNLAIEEKYNFKIKEYQNFNYQTEFDVKKLVQSGDDSYDVYVLPTRTSGNLARNGYMTDLKTVDYIDLSKPWWNQDAVKGLSMGNRLFFMHGDLMIMDNDATEAMIFNKKLIADLGLEVPYTLVKNGTWTLDKLNEYMRAGWKDLSGNGLPLGTDDQFGLCIQLDSICALMRGAGVTMGTKDQNDYIVDSFQSERMYAALDRIYDLINSDYSINLHNYEGKMPEGVYTYQTNMFSNNQALTSWIRLRVVETLRGMETDFGIIPMPKLDEAQEKYYSSINVHTSTAISIPVSCSDISRAGFVLEALSAESKYTLQPAYYEIALRGKYTRDDESQEMLDIIFANMVYDVFEQYPVGGLGDLFYERNMKTNSKDNYVSRYEKIKGAIEKDIQKLIDNFESF
jgi:ABC-type glycerol-3-phosphate transport system substrate-binding protein